MNGVIPKATPSRIPQNGSVTLSGTGQHDSIFSPITNKIETQLGHITHGMQYAPKTGWKEVRMEGKMKTVREALKDKGEGVYRLSPGQTVFSAAELMTEKQIGAVVVAEGERMYGVFSERDIMTRVVSRGLNPHTVAVGEVMSMDVVYALPDESTEECILKMRSAKCRHLPVVEDGHLLGMISLRDLLGLEVEDRAEQVERLDGYIWYRPPRTEDRSKSN